MSPSRRNPTEPETNHGHTVLSVTASLVVGAAIGLQAWNNTSSLIQSIALGAGIAIVAGALFRIALDGSTLLPVLRQWMTGNGSSSNNSSGLADRLPSSITTAGLTHQLLGRPWRRINFELPTGTWSTLDFGSATLVRSIDESDEQTAIEPALEAEATEPLCAGAA